MSLSFPLSTAAFFDTLRLASFTFPPSYGQESSGTGGGKLIVKDLRPMLWSAQGATVDLSFDDFAAVSASLEAVAEAMGSFYAYDITKKYPIKDPTGSILGAASVIIDTITGNYSIKLSGLPAGYIVSRGDFLSWNDGVSQMLHRAVETVTADGFGLTPLFDVRPKLSGASVTTTPVTLIKPTCEMMLVPGSFTHSDGSSVMSRILSFQAIQARH